MDFVSGTFLRRPATTHRHIPGTGARFPALVNKARGILSEREGEGREEEREEEREANRKLVLKCTSGLDLANLQAALNLVSHFMKYNLIFAEPLHLTNSIASEMGEREREREEDDLSKQDEKKRGM